MAAIHTAAQTPHANALLSGLSVEQLIARELPAAQRGDAHAFARIVAVCQNAVTAIALAITHDVPSSEDIAQDAFIAAWQHLRRLNNPSSFLPWLRQITRNLARDHLRARQHRPLDGEGAELAIALAADPGPGPAQRLEDDERERAAAELIAALPDDSRELLLLYYREGQRSQQVAALLGISDAAVRKRLSRARQGLHADLLARFGDFARSTAPGAALVAAISTALTVASPPAAAKAIIGASVTTGVAKSLGSVVLGAAAGIGLALMAALAGMLLSLRASLRGALDEVERRALVRIEVINAIATVVFITAMLLAATLTSGRTLAVLMVVSWAVFMAVVVHQNTISRPRVLARRHAHEATLDPANAERRRRRERVCGRLGLVLGIVCGVGGLIAGLLKTLH